MLNKIIFLVFPFLIFFDNQEDFTGIHVMWNPKFLYNWPSETS